ncbi:TIR domain-containing protein [Pseudoxanthomonas mexicana]
MAKRQIFYSFHFNNDVMRVQQVRNMGLVDGNTPVSVNDWETIKKSSASVERWIDNNMKGTSCVIVLIGTDTSKRPWVNYEIKKAWEDGKGLLGIHIHNLNCPNNGTCHRGSAGIREKYSRIRFKFLMLRAFLLHTPLRPRSGLLALRVETE